MRTEPILIKIEAFLKNRVERGSYLWNILSKTKGFILRGMHGLLMKKIPHHRWPLEKILDVYFRQHQNIFFIQLGACDGVIFDPINMFITQDNCSGILVEPVKHLFNQLRSKYMSFDRLRLENVAIANINGSKDFYRLDDKILDEVAPYFKGMGTFIPEVLYNAVPRGMEKHIIREKISCLTLDALLTKHNITKVDLFLIDTEGYDYEIIKLIDFKKIKPSLIIYESKHLRIQDNNDCIKYLSKNGYTLFQSGYDIVAYRENG